MRNNVLNAALKQILPATAVAFALGISAPVLANPTNTANDSASVDEQTANASADARGHGSAANEYSTSEYKSRANNSETDNSDNSDNSNNSNQDNVTSSHNNNSTGRNDHSTSYSNNNKSNQGNTELTSSRNDNRNQSDNRTNYNNDSRDQSIAHNSSHNDSSTESSYNTDGSNNVEGSHNVEESHNTDSSADASSYGAAANGGSSASVTHDESNHQNWDTDSAVARSQLSAEVSGNTVRVPAQAEGASITARNNFSNSFGGAAGISQVGQNSGANGMVQQSVNVQSNLRLSSGGNNGSGGTDSGGGA